MATNARDTLRDLKRKNDLKDAILVIVLTIFVFLPVAIVGNGLVAQQLWEWFIEPTFSIAAPNIWLIIGLSMTITFFFKIDTVKKEAETFKKDNMWESFWNAWGRLFARWFFVLAFGYIYHSMSSYSFGAS